jgi:hypothetical protein
LFFQKWTLFVGNVHAKNRLVTGGVDVVDVVDVVGHLCRFFYTWVLRTVRLPLSYFFRLEEETTSTTSTKRGNPRGCRAKPVDVGKNQRPSCENT